MRAALINKENIVANVIVWDKTCVAPTGFTVVELNNEEKVSIGYTYTNGNFISNEEPLPQPTYAELRAAEYPPITDYLDGVVKGDQAQIDAYIAACQAVKAKYPKV